MVIERQRGWPMGGSLSELSTLIDLQEDFRFFAGIKKGDIKLGDLVPGLAATGLSFQQIVQAIQHVDDTCLFSKCLCIFMP